MLRGKNILLGITGGIAAYKAAELARIFVKEGFQVQVIMTPSATRLISPLTFQSLTGAPVGVELFSGDYEGRVRHIDLAGFPDLAVIAPATANTIARIALGIADNLLATVIMATTAPVLVAPSMNDGMYQNPAFQENLERLRSRGFYILDAPEGDLACGTSGKGRMAEPGEIFRAAVSVLERKQDFAGLRTLVTAGPTREPIDPVRFISNRSTGKMGYAVAGALRERGAEVCLVTGPTVLSPPVGVELVPVETTAEMYNEVVSRFEGVHLVIKTAAVSDYRPREQASQKIKKGRGEGITLALAENPDILKELGNLKNKQILVGFAMETRELVENAREKLVSKNLDFIVANDLTVEGAGFAVDTNVVKIIKRDGSVLELPLMTKISLAHRLLDEILSLRNHGKEGQ